MVIHTKDYGIECYIFFVYCFLNKCTYITYQQRTMDIMVTYIQMTQPLFNCYIYIYISG